MGRKIKCNFGNCNSNASFGNLDNKAEKCFKHKLLNMINKTNQKCHYNNCQKYSSYGFSGQVKKYCTKHKIINMVDLVSKKCKLCSINASYGYTFNKIREYCVTHKLEGMINKCSVICKYNNCKLVAFFADKDGEKQFCFKHKKDNMINKGYSICTMEKCQKITSYEINGLQYCYEHKPVNSKSIRKCIIEKCDNKPYYGFFNKKKEYCSFHKQDGMCYKSLKICKELNCNTLATFGLKLDGEKEYCKKHRKSNMVNMNHRKCKFNNCQIVGSYGYDNKRDFCVKHKEEDMFYYNNNNKKKSDEINLFDDHDIIVIKKNKLY